jgi:hypothetical protein
MPSSSFMPRGQKSRTLLISWVISIVVIGFAFENIWIDPRIARRFHGFPSFAPESGSTYWLLAFAAISVCCMLLVVGQILLIRRAGVSRLAKGLTALVAVFAILLSVGWFRTTSGYSLVPRLELAEKPHTVSLTWIASTTPSVGYVVYRRKLGSGEGYTALFTDPIHKLTYVDASVINGEKYEYAVKAVDAHGNMSDFSTPTSASIP